MTSREFYQNLLVEINKVEAPSMLLEDYIYFANKAVQQYINKAYNKFDMNQQSSDDLRWLQSTVRLPINDIKAHNGNPIPKESHTWVAELPKDYMHILNCIVSFDSGSKDDSDSICPDPESIDGTLSSVARRLTADQYPTLIRNYYLKPSRKTPYFYINNLDGNRTMEIRCGRDSEPIAVYIDYLRTPKKIELDYDDIESMEDTTQQLEFPEYVAYEIINELVKLVLENVSDPRLQTNVPINNTILNPLAVQQTKK